MQIERRHAASTSAGACERSAWGDCWDNAVAERFFSTLEWEGPASTTWRRVADAEPELYEFIEAYNARLHSTNDYCSPNETEAGWRQEARAA